MDEQADGRRQKSGAAREEVRAAHWALSFLTVLPLPDVGHVPGDRPARATAYYPLAGYAVGGLATLVLLLPLDPGLRAALALAVWWGLTGLLHLDGLIDSADALLAPVPVARRLQILRDVHVGAFGLASAVLVTLVAWTALSATESVLAPLVAAVLARSLVLIPMQLWPAARPDGFGVDAQSTAHSWRWAAALALAAPTLLLPGAWPAWVGAPVAMALVAPWAARRLGGGLTGDTYGLLIVLGELGALVALAG
ncbi:MAG: adenosylcobinamide-GDP ribazoletransferase [Ornithinimicrobium sp.]|uniref:adenosylcobinamide-GDP ribazoletransferase n=1 Tax=Ornithinimicrobium sp. TaxID=1977084 RepID=UPI003D9B03B6